MDEIRSPKPQRAAEAVADKIRKGIEALLNPTVISHEHLPMLEVIFDRLINNLSTSLRNLTSDNVEIVLEKITSLRFGEHLEQIAPLSLTGIFRAEEWDSSALLIADNSLSSSIVDVLLGGKKGGKSDHLEKRPYTTIERNLVSRLLSIVLADLETAFEPLTPVKFRLDRVESNPKFVGIVRPNSSAFLIKFKISMEGCGGFLEFLIPYATVEPVRHLLLEMFLGEKFGQDPLWEEHLTKEIRQTNITLQGILDEFSIPLKEVLKWKKGFSLPLTVYPDSQVTLRCQGHPIFVGKMGQKSGSIAISIETDCLTHEED